ncbi:Aldehyde Dehydrogenase [Catenulispora acidiphila DSM 44928]|uniref:Aldehyde Dehydrogenase n=1 Tax=Catenulispora acidiphila (strain DSM 44928 / JCM 14897 / NBRC 102108 / NRRL B-24433 / ID139908) TaxID=479433 RepID=C7QE41_CATAD|nr:aldehyde dehydrogenase family protein [Catenulispora acidiphila]ACU76629.1 Aldehyde Dehydrogenase [Catenulispora acidiphila DSM 44928]
MTYHTTLDQAAGAAAAAAGVYGSWNAERRRDLLHACADAVDAARAELVELAGTETALTSARLDGEVTRTTGQLRLYGDHVAAGRHLSRRSSPGAGLGGADVYTVDVPLGPVAVFAASNFPFAFGVPGGDTASALAAGCPVVVKGHPAQPRLSRRIAEILSAAVAGAGAPEGTFGFLDAESTDGDPNKLSIELVQHPAIKAVGFTGSFGGGRALMDAAAARPEPIPVYAEMGSVNPVFVLPGAIADEAGRQKWAQTLAGAVTGSGGQLCTKPGVVFVPEGDDGAALGALTGGLIADNAAIPMLTEGMAAAHRRWSEQTAESGADARFAAGEGQEADSRSGLPFAVEITAKDFTGGYREEHFGPAAVIVRADPADYPALADSLEGQLTATIIADDASDADREAARALLPSLVAKAGRVVWNGVPTGVAVVEAMQHGGPWPATSASWSTSVGTEAIRRFIRPVALQGVPADLVG